MGAGQPVKLRLSGMLHSPLPLLSEVRPFESTFAPCPITAYDRTRRVRLRPSNRDASPGGNCECRSGCYGYCSGWRSGDHQCVSGSDDRCTADPYARLHTHTSSDCNPYAYFNAYPDCDSRIDPNANPNTYPRAYGNGHPNAKANGYGNSDTHPNAHPDTRIPGRVQLHDGCGVRWPMA